MNKKSSSTVQISPNQQPYLETRRGNKYERIETTQEILQEYEILEDIKYEFKEFFRSEMVYCKEKLMELVKELRKNGWNSIHDIPSDLLIDIDKYKLTPAKDIGKYAKNSLEEASRQEMLGSRFKKALEQFRLNQNHDLKISEGGAYNKKKQFKNNLLLGLTNYKVKRNQKNIMYIFSDEEEFEENDQWKDEERSKPESAEDEQDQIFSKALEKYLDELHGSQDNKQSQEEASQQSQTSNEQMSQSSKLQNNVNFIEKEIDEICILEDDEEEEQPKEATRTKLQIKKDDQMKKPPKENQIMEKYLVPPTKKKVILLDDSSDEDEDTKKKPVQQIQQIQKQSESQNPNTNISNNNSSEINSNNNQQQESQEEKPLNSKRQFIAIVEEDSEETIEFPIRRNLNFNAQPYKKLKQNIL